MGTVLSSVLLTAVIGIPISVPIVGSVHPSASRPGILTLRLPQKLPPQRATVELIPTDIRCSVTVLPTNTRHRIVLCRRQTAKP